jgi:hypothetical protein
MLIFLSSLVLDTIAYDCIQYDTNECSRKKQKKSNKIIKLMIFYSVLSYLRKEKRKELEEVYQE